MHIKSTELLEYSLLRVFRVTIYTHKISKNITKASIGPKVNVYLPNIGYFD